MTAVPHHHLLGCSGLPARRWTHMHKG